MLGTALQDCKPVPNLPRGHLIFSVKHVRANKKDNNNACKRKEKEKHFSVGNAYRT